MQKQSRGARKIATVLIFRKITRKKIRGGVLLQ